MAKQGFKPRFPTSCLLHPTGYPLGSYYHYFYHYSFWHRVCHYLPSPVSFTVLSERFSGKEYIRPVTANPIIPPLGSSCEVSSQTCACSKHILTTASFFLPILSFDSFNTSDCLSIIFLACLYQQIYTVEKAEAG